MVRFARCLLVAGVLVVACLMLDSVDTVYADTVRFNVR